MGKVAGIFLVGFAVFGFIATDSAGYGVAGAFLLLSIAFGVVAIVQRVTRKPKPVAVAPPVDLAVAHKFCPHCGAQLKE